MCSRCGKFFLCFAIQSADRSGMAVSRFLAAAAASVTLSSFAAETRKSHCHGCMKVVTGALAAISFVHYFPVKSASKSSFFPLGVEIRFWNGNLCSRCVFFLGALQLSLQIAVEWLCQGSSLPRLRPQYYCLVQLRLVNGIVVAA